MKSDDYIKIDSTQGSVVSDISFEMFSPKLTDIESISVPFPRSVEFSFQGTLTPEGERLFKEMANAQSPAPFVQDFESFLHANGYEPEFIKQTMSAVIDYLNNLHKRMAAAL